DPVAPPLEPGLDVFHTAREAHRVLARHWRRAEAAWEKAAGAEAELAGAKRQGIDARGPARAAGAAWRRATPAPEDAHRRASGPGPGRRGRGVVRGRRPAQRPDPGRGRDRYGAEGSRRPRVVPGPPLPHRPAEPGLPGPDASSAECGRTAAAVARGDGLALVAA